MKKNEVVILEIENIGEGGEGVAKVDGFTIFVPFALPKERVEAKLILVKKSFAVAKLQSILRPAANRVEPPCPLFYKCGGCQIMHMSDALQKDYKRQKVVDAMQRIGFVKTEVLPVVSGEKGLRYRNKLQIPVSEDERGRLIAGFYATNSHRIVENEDCLLQNEDSVRAYRIVMDYAFRAGISGYKEDKNKGLLRHIVTRTTEREILITLVINGDHIPDIELLKNLLSGLNKDVGVYLNINRKQTNVVFGEKFIHLFGIKALALEDNGLKYEVLPQSFLQVNEEIKTKIYDKAVVLADLSKKDVVVNAYSGAGLLTAYFAKRAELAYGVELVKEASESADILAKNNGLDGKMKNITGDCKEEIEKLFPELSKSGKDVVFVLDPPRKGVDIEILKVLKKLQPKKIIYISCNPATLARDVGILVGTLKITDKGLEKSEEGNTSLPSSSYQVSYIEPYDMFPQTKHIETLVCLTRKN